MQASLAVTALVMGLAGGPHCIAMCGAACAGIGQAAAPRGTQAIGMFQVGRVAGYAALGAVASATMQGLGWLTVQSAALRPLWTMVHVAAIMLGLLLLIQARQPAWLETGARRVWARVRSATQSMGLVAPLGLGVAWALLPCGLLYSAVMVAALAGSVPGGAAVMALFALGSGVSLWAGPWLLLKLGNRTDRPWGMRLAGLALLLTAGWGLWMGLVHDQAPWCVVPR
ncbi:sulfite exporter TauE/SafE family protein [Ottowia sp. SB7-C50]|jgi:sulfite exporter TauE/SafE|uniref:sulfite exporter TauE/SafE family protein n=1 Tax=Ottowia sp. SB7-C50 TaxID=3081231 RepID=UPI0029548593|nr:sulfite exporter TauE/SafE family protein [Ottowia sp. SB7-C50]WOP16920.1 sulfite exporter TauE/SafE family protein [Ottowia sp. SB7-C50]